MQVTFEEAATVITRRFELGTPEEFLAFAAEDKAGGYPNEWMYAGLFESEGQILYALVRILRPSVILELGTGYGCSGTHIRNAMDKNRKGKMVSVDWWHGAVKNPHKRVTYEFSSAVEFAQAWDKPVDFVFEDSEHKRDVTREVYKALLPHLTPGGMLVSHDVEHFLVGPPIVQGFQDAVGDFLSVVVPPSDCGLGLWRKPLED